MTINTDMLRAAIGGGPMDNFDLCNEANNAGRNLKEELKAAEEMKAENNQLKEELQRLRAEAAREREESDRAFYAREDKVKNVTAVKDAYGRLKRETDRILHKMCMDDMLYQRAYMEYKEAVNTAYDKIE